MLDYIESFISPTGLAILAIGISILYQARHEKRKEKFHSSRYYVTGRYENRMLGAFIRLRRQILWQRLRDATAMSIAASERLHGRASSPEISINGFVDEDQAEGTMHVHS